MDAVETVAVRFDDVGPHPVVDIVESLSTIKTEGRHLWLGGDETATIERVTLGAAGDIYDNHVSFPVGDFLPLPAGPDADGAIPEIDIEGFDRHGDYLWFVGSHSLTRKRVRPHHATEDALRALAKIRKNANRHLLGRIPVVTQDGLPTLVGSAAAPDGAGGQRTAAALGLRKQTRVTTVLKGDEHLGPFLTIPSKDNGLDVEGLAVVGERVYLGLRGPVLRGWAVVVELRPTEGDGQDLGLRPLDGGLPYRKHFLNLDGLGVRDLLAQGDDLLVLAGPTMDLDGPVRVYRWRGAARAATSVVVDDEALVRVLDLPFGEGDDHAEGIALAPGDPSSILVVHDSPAAHRRPAPGVILVDVFRLP
ncbi:DUF3616 domain-containing protein [Candidatus Frankia meridionalis]|uniref:DUF3616 domain-containing protein n=1 Tax=Candidatus Protofrankia datiscae TaxID=2716812 RepID=F8AVX0_9ACTN|nr:hypothetical protein FsymDg_0798 [Candidatus Protofrankia datiscae]